MIFTVTQLAALDKPIEWGRYWGKVRSFQSVMLPDHSCNLFNVASQEFLSGVGVREYFFNSAFDIVVIHFAIGSGFTVGAVAAEEAAVDTEGFDCPPCIFFSDIDCL